MIGVLSKETFNLQKSAQTLNEQASERDCCLAIYLQSEHSKFGGTRYASQGKASQYQDALSFGTASLLHPEDC